MKIQSPLPSVYLVVVLAICVPLSTPVYSSYGTQWDWKTFLEYGAYGSQWDRITSRGADYSSEQRRCHNTTTTHPTQAFNLRKTYTTERVEPVRALPLIPHQPAHRQNVNAKKQSEKEGGLAWALVAGPGEVHLLSCVRLTHPWRHPPVPRVPQPYTPSPSSRTLSSSGLPALSALLRAGLNTAQLPGRFTPTTTTHRQHHRQRPLRPLRVMPCRPCAHGRPGRRRPATQSCVKPSIDCTNKVWPCASRPPP